VDDEPTLPPPAGSSAEATDGLTRRHEREAAEQASDGTTTGPTPAGGTKSPTRNLIEWVAVIVGAIVIAVVVRTFILQTFWIPSPSMSPTLVENDRVLVNKLSYKLHDINRGDVIVFGRPPTEEPSEIKDLIKRVVGLPGESVSVLDGKVYIDGRELEEPYTNDLPTLIQDCPTTYVPGIDTEQGFEVPEDTVLVMGDNRTNSRDGRCFGPVDEDLVVGRAFFIMWPPSHAGGL
jgi:signal peptidase I